MRRSLARMLLLALAGCATVDGDTGKDEVNSDANDTQASDELPIHGELTTRYRGRSSSESDDHDLYQYVTVDVGDERNALSAHVMAQGALDLDGRDENEFTSLQDTLGSSLTSRIYHAYVDVHAARELELLRVGRQQVYETPEVVTFDGVRAETHALGTADVSLGAYGGLPFYPFESSRSGTGLVGLYGSAWPWSGGSVRLDWMHLEDEALLGQHSDDLLSASVGQSLGEHWQLQGDYSRLEDEDRDFRVRLSAYAPDADLAADVTYYQLLNTQLDHTLPLDPYFNTLFELFPFWQGRFNLSKGFGESFDLATGVDLRRVLDESDVGASNRDFERYFLTGNFAELPADFALGLTGDVWESDGSDIYAWSLDLTRPVGASSDLTLGTYYSLYKFDVQSGEERERVRTWYVGIDWRREQALRFGVRYEYEDADIDDFHDVRLEATWSF